MSLGELCYNAPVPSCRIAVRWANHLKLMMCGVPNGDAMLVHCWCNVGAMLVQCWCSFYNCTKTAPTLHQNGAVLVQLQKLHQHCTNIAPTLHQHCTNNAPALHHHCITIASPLHHHCQHACLIYLVRQGSSQPCASAIPGTYSNASIKVLGVRLAAACANA